MTVLSYALTIMTKRTFAEPMKNHTTLIFHLRFTCSPSSREFRVDVEQLVLRS